MLVFGVGERVRHFRGGTIGRRLEISLLSDWVDSAPPIMTTSCGVAGVMHRGVGSGMEMGTGAGTGWVTGLLTFITWLLLLLLLLWWWLRLRALAPPQPPADEAEELLLRGPGPELGIGSGGREASRTSRAFSGLRGLRLCGVSMSTDPESTLELRESLETRSCVKELVVPGNNIEQISRA